VSVKVLFDTSILVAGSLTQHPSYDPCFAQLKAAQVGQIQGYLSTHSLAETYSVLTRLPIQPRLTPSYAESVILNLLRFLEPISIDSADYLAAIAQMRTLNLPGGGIFDSLIAQAALKAQVDRILTLNPSHFTRLSEAIAHLTQVPTQQN
jgi:predicted nucleic acid-binding protein